MEVKAVIICLLWISIQRIYCLQDIEFQSKQNVATDNGAEVDFERLENEYAVGNVSAVTQVYENITIPEIESITTENSQTKLDNIQEFKPSWHLGEIGEIPTANSNPFNKISHLEFDNSYAVQSQATNWNTNLPSINKERDQIGRNNFNNNNNVNFFPSSMAKENHFFRKHNNGGSLPHVIPPSYQIQNIIPNAYQNSLHHIPTLHRPEFPVNSGKKMYFETTYVQEIPQHFEDHASGSFLHDEVNFVPPFNDLTNTEYGKPFPPSFGNYQEPNNVKVHAEIQEFLPNGNQRFPYKFHRETLPTLMDGNLEYVADEQVFHNVPRERRVSLWKKIIHLIGTILPFGLLLASLTPNVVQISNSTAATIPLSKLKDFNLPPEHKSSRMNYDDQTNCEEKNICEVILAGSKPKSNLLQNILWNFVVRTSEKTAEDNGLRELFEAVKKRDCSLIPC